MLLAGILLRVDVYVIGRLSASEVFLACLMPFYITRRPRVSNRVTRQFSLWISVFALAIVASDLWNDTDTNLMIRGLARPIIIALMFVTFVHVMQKQPGSIRFFFIGLLLSGVINVFFHTDFRAALLEDADVASYGYQAFVYTPLVYGILSVGAWVLSRHSQKASVTWLILGGVLVAAQLSRTTSLVFILSGILMLYAAKIGATASILSKLRSAATPIMFVIIPITLLALYHFMNLYIEAALAGWAGDRTAAKVASQIANPTANQVLNMFLNGRHYNVSNALMIWENPLFGTGSWPIEGPYVLRALNWLGVDVSNYYMEKIIQARGIGHSILFGSWANYGFQGCVFWIMSLKWIYSYSMLLFRRRDSVLWLTLPYILIFTISIFFNNLNSLNRVMAALLPAALAVTYYNRLPPNPYTYVQRRR